MAKFVTWATVLISLIKTKRLAKTPTPKIEIQGVLRSPMMQKGSGRTPEQDIAQTAREPAANEKSPVLAVAASDMTEIMTQRSRQELLRLRLQVEQMND